MSTYRIFLILSVFSSLAFSSNVCKWQSPCKCVLQNDKVIDLTSVGRLEYPRFYEVSFNLSKCSDNANELYSYNPCFTFDSSDKHTTVTDGHKPCKGAAACIRTPGKSDGQFPEEYVIGLQNTANFVESDLHYSINYTAPGFNKPVIVKLICNEDNHNLLEVEEPNCSNNDQIVFTLTSKCACPDKCKGVGPLPSDSSPGLSIGSKLLIAFFTILLAYFIVGVFWNFCNGSQGAELIPNIQFWNDLPTLIMEGVVFTFSCCGRKSSYGEV